MQMLAHWIVKLMFLPCRLGMHHPKRHWTTRAAYGHMMLSGCTYRCARCRKVLS
jgi:hypothetical protein